MRVCKTQSQPSNRQTSRFAPHGLKAQKLLAQGNALSITAVNKAPCKGKSIKRLGFDYYESYKVNPYSITWDTEIKLTAEELYNIAEPLPSYVDFKELDKGILDEIAEEQERLKRKNCSFTSDVGSCFWGCLAFPITLPARIIWFILRKARSR